jgi:uncharacterized protein YprB with RNaseH-like and TPR domain
LKILFFDLETTPHSGLYWGDNWQTSIIEQIEYGKILSYSASWLGENKIITRGWTDVRRFQDGERTIVRELHTLLNEADAVVAHNGKKFDIKKCNSAFVSYGLTPPSPYKVIDTMAEAKKYISLPSYSLNNIANYFKLGGKIEHEGFSLWKKCINGDKKAWKKMKRYNRHDVVLLKKVYFKLRPWMHPHINAGMYADKLVCPKCGSKELQSRGWAITNTMRYKRIQCVSCGSWGRDTHSVYKIKPIVSI